MQHCYTFDIINRSDGIVLEYGYFFAILYDRYWKNQFPSFTKCNFVMREIYLVSVFNNRNLYMLRVLTYNFQTIFVPTKIF